MTKKKAVATLATFDDETDLSYIPQGLRPLAVHCDGLNLDPANIKDHGDVDLPAHAASLKQFGILRAIVVRRDTMTVLAGNGTLQACRLNGWDYVPALFVDFDEKRGRAYALADNAVATLAPWNKSNLETLTIDLKDLDLGIDLNGLGDQILEELASYEADEEEEVLTVPLPGDDQGPVNLSRRVIAICKDETEQIALVAELKKRGFQAELKTITVK